MKIQKATNESLSPLRKATYQGDRAAWDCLVAHTPIVQAAIYNEINRRYRNDNRAELIREVTPQVFINIINSCERNRGLTWTYTPGANQPTSWLYTVITNQVRDVLNQLRASGPIPAPSRQIHQRLNELREAEAYLQHQLLRQPTVSEVADYLQMSLEELHKLKSHVVCRVSTDSIDSSKRHKDSDQYTTVEEIFQCIGNPVWGLAWLLKLPC